MKLDAADQIRYEQNLEKAKNEKSATARAIYRHKFLLKAADALVALQRNSIVCEPKFADESEIKLGASKFGGRPDLPPEIEWFARRNEREPKPDAENPIAKGELMPLAFLAQINLADAKRFDADDLLPAAGRLYFFYLDRMFRYDAGIWTSEDDVDAGNLKVLYDDSPAASLTRREFPDALPESRRFRAARVKFAAAIDFPHSDNPQLFGDALEKTADAREARWIYDEKLPRQQAKGYRKNKMFGHVDAQFPYLDPKEVLLLQFMDYPSGFRFSRDGFLCLWARRDDLRRREWDKINFEES